jgi:hypothetical protein
MTRIVALALLLLAIGAPLGAVGAEPNTDDVIDDAAAH